MEYIYAVRSSGQLRQYQAFHDNIHSRFDLFLNFLAENYAVTDIPKATVFTDARTATKLLSNIPVPAYTSEYRTVFCPDLESWKQIYLQQLEDAECPEARAYYENRISENHLLQILGHEFVHHSDLFLDDAYEKTRWFEEGMCEYISRRYFLTEEEFQEEMRINAFLVRQFEAAHGVRPLEAFCEGTYNGALAAIFYFYWRSFLAVHTLVERMGGDPFTVFREYLRWFQESPTTPLSRWFPME